MKKWNLFIALLICITASAQFNKSFGIKAGANYAKYIPYFDFYGAEVVYFKCQVSYYVVAFSILGISVRPSLSLDLLFPTH